MMRVVIIGNSAAGLAALEAFRKRNKTARVLMIDREPCSYSRVMTPYFISGRVDQKEGLLLRSEIFFKELGVETRFGDEVEGIDIRSRVVALRKGQKEGFDLLLIATGASPNHPEIRGGDRGEILVLRSLGDAQRLKNVRSRAGKLLFWGAGLVSLQTLQALYRASVRYTLVVKSDRILSQVLDAEASEIAEKNLKTTGVRVIKGRDVVRWKKDGGVKIAVLDNNQEIEADFIFAGKGVRPNTSFLQDSGIKMREGILVDEHLKTNVEGIYAAGDVAQAPDFFSGERVNYGLWPSAVEQGEIAGKNMAGLREPYVGNLKMNITRIFDLPMASIGDYGSSKVAATMIHKDEEKNLYRKLCVSGEGVLIGAILLNGVEDFGVIYGLIRGRREAGLLKRNSIWKTPMSYGMVYREMLESRG
jgi:NADPH-dependent 2,4-dienoyl-CoA reductase/sulfur reductase-like enzyme